MNYLEWLGSVPKEGSDDPLWGLEVYRQALFLGELAWFDATRLAKDKQSFEDINRTVELWIADHEF